MKNIVKAAAAVLAFSILPLASAVAQSQTRVNVPFAFHVGSTTLPAGTYTITTQAGRQILAISQWESKINIQAAGMIDRYSEATPSTAVFHHVGNQYFLHEIVSSNSSSAFCLPVTRAERMAKRETERAGLTPSDPVLLAMN